MSVCVCVSVSVSEEGSLMTQPSLVLIAGASSPECAKVILACKGVDVNVRDKRSATPLHYCAGTLH